MSGLPWTVAIVLAVWLLAGLVLEAVLAWRQWRHLARVEPGREPAATHCRRIRYGQRRALFQWLASAETVLRVAVWLGGGLSLLARAVTPDGWLSGVVFVALFAAVDQLLGQPLRWGRWWAVERAFGTSRLDAAGMARDGLASGGLAVLLATLAAAWTLWPFGLLPAAVAWPLCGLLAIAAALAYFWARPNLIAPLFNRFTSLPAGALRERLAAMMTRSGAHLSDVRIMDGSRRSTLANAYFAGVGRSKRIVLLDTLMEQLPPAEIEAVLAHELGHFRCGHLQRYYGLLFGLILAAVSLLPALLSAAGMEAAPVVMAAALFVLLPALAWPLRPLLSALKRRYEYEADAFAARHAEPAALVSALRRLLAHNLNAPTMDRWYAAFHATHPPGDERLSRLRCYM